MINDGDPKLPLPTERRSPYPTHYSFLPISFSPFCRTDFECRVSSRVSLLFRKKIRNNTTSLVLEFTPRSFRFRHQNRFDVARVDTRAMNSRDPLLIISTTVQSGTKSFLPLHLSDPRSARRDARVTECPAVYTRTTRNDLRALDSVPIPPYNSETGDKSDSPGSFLPPLHFPSPSVRSLSLSRPSLAAPPPLSVSRFFLSGPRENNNRHKLSAEIALVLHDLLDAALARSLARS